MKHGKRHRLIHEGAPRKSEGVDLLPFFVFFRVISWIDPVFIRVSSVAPPERNRIARRRIVLTATGSLGDLHPYIAIALGLVARGHEAIVATSACYRDKIDALGLGFRVIRPDADFVTDPARMRRYMDLRRGTIRIVRELILPV